jgi:hypothetical protein
MKKWANELNRLVSKDKKDKTHMKKCSPSLAIKEMQIKNKMTTNVGEDVGGKGTLTHCWLECKLVQPL